MTAIFPALRNKRINYNFVRVFDFVHGPVYCQHFVTTCFQLLPPVTIEIQSCEKYRPYCTVEINLKKLFQLVSLPIENDIKQKCG